MILDHPLFLFAAYFLAGVGYVALFVAIYVRVTPFAEFKLVREGNVPASVTLGGAILGYCLPLHRAISQSLVASDLFVWATIALVVQLLTFVIFSKCMPRLSQRVEEGSLAKAVLLASIAVAVGLINAAAMTE